MNYYDKKGIDAFNTTFGNTFTRVSLILFISSLTFFILSSSCKIPTTTSKWFLLFALNCVFDVVIHVFMGFLWGHDSMHKLKVVKNDGKDHADGKVNLSELREASWQPRIVGILERIIMTASFIIGKYELVGGWLVLKVVRIHNNSEGNKQKNSLWRVTENMFLIGTAFSLITSFIGAVIYNR